jgi:cytochrome c oxidase subunit 3
MRIRVAGNVDGLPSEVEGSRNLTWWGSLGGEAIEGFVMVLAVFAYLYLRAESPDWPPLHTPLPSLGIPTLNLGLMFLSILPAWWAFRSARRRQRVQTAVGLAVHALIGTTILVLRYYEMRALNVRWDTNAYGSLGWSILFAHGYMAVFDIFDTAGLLLLFLRLQPEEKHFIDETENSFFRNFDVGNWVPIYLLIFISPHWM